MLPQDRRHRKWSPHRAEVPGPPGLDSGNPAAPATVEAATDPPDPENPMRRPFPSILAVATAAFLAALVTAATLAPSGQAAETPGAAARRTVTTTATGTASGVPDTATIVLGVDTGGPTAEAALAANAAKTQGVIDGTKFVGVKERDIGTSRLTLFPTFDRQGRINGYSVSSRLTVRTHDVPNAGKVIDAAAQLAGDNVRVDGITLSIEDTGPVVRQARTEAVTTARTQARQLAAAAETRLGPVRTIVETRNEVFAEDFGAALRQGSAAADVAPIEPGTQELSIHVKVVYDLR
jgi:uncharacterized protein YggE